MINVVEDVGVWPALQVSGDEYLWWVMEWRGWAALGWAGGISSPLGSLERLPSSCALPPPSQHRWAVEDDTPSAPPRLTPPPFPALPLSHLLKSFSQVSK